MMGMMGAVTTGTGKSRRTLLVLRHGKSDWPDGVPDHERPLAARGRREAPLVGRWLREQSRLPDLVLCSPAARARQTWDQVAAELLTAPAARYDDRVYEASAGGLLSVINETPDEVRILLVVGHNPAIENLAGLLAGEGGNAAAERRMAAKFPTAALAVLEFDGSWSGLEPAGARLADFFVGRKG
jgi:phosphohistidine phosphatase